MEGRAEEEKELTRPDALPDVDALPSRIPDAALGVERPLDVELPDASGVADDGGRADGVAD